MHVQRVVWTDVDQPAASLSEVSADAHLVLSFGHVDAPSADWFTAIQQRCPNAQHVYTSGGGQIVDGLVQDETTVSVFVTFERNTSVHPVLIKDVSISNSPLLGRSLGQQLAAVQDLRHVLIFAEGLSFDAAAFLNTLNAELPTNVHISGGLASNGMALSRTVVGLNGVPAERQLVAVGIAGTHIDIGTGSVGGWEHFGPERIVTSASVAAVHELDGERAIDVYKRYLGDFAKELPGSALLFPLAVRPTPDSPIAVRTILGIDDATGTMRFAGDIPVGSRVRLMRTTRDQLLDGAAQAAEFARVAPDSPGDSLTLCISCIGRRAVLRTRVEEEIEEVTREAGSDHIVGFYSNGEIAPPDNGGRYGQAVLHNQTMTVTTLRER